MDESTARELTRLTGEFYAATSASFSATRSSAWPGWMRVLAEAGLAGHTTDSQRRVGSPRVLDLACGNLRFERFLAEELAGGAEQGCMDDHEAVAEAYAFDSCDDLARGQSVPTVRVHYRHLDIVEALWSGGDLAAQLATPPCDLCVCFGFMHHLPFAEQRVRVLRALVDSARPGGVVAVSFWQLSRSARLLAKARATTERAVAEQGLRGLDEGDYLLGWQDRDDVLRYCHDFCETEVDELAAAVASAAREVARFSADGASGDLNRYLLLRACNK